MKQYTVQPLDFSGLNTYSVHDRHSKVTVEDFAGPVRPGMTVGELIASLPNQFAGQEFPEFIGRMVTAIRNQRPVLLGMGAHVIKVGLNPILIDLMEQGVISAIALNGAGIIHDTDCLLYTSPSPRDRTRSRMPSSA